MSHIWYRMWAHWVMLVAAVTIPVSARQKPNSTRALALALLLVLSGPAHLSAQQSSSPSFTARTVFNGAGYSRGRFAPDSWVTVYGANLKVGHDVVVPEEGFPTSLAGTTVTITDTVGFEHAAGLRFVAYGTLSFLAPSGIAIGPATLTVTNADGLSGSALVQIDRVAPGLFAANENGRDAAAGTYLRVLADGQRAEGFSFISNAIAGTRSNLPMPFGEEGNQIYLSLWGTGFRDAASVHVRIGEVGIPVLAAVAHSVSAGLDQLVLGPMPRSLVNVGETTVELMADGVTANPVTVSFLEEPGPEAAVVYEFSPNLYAVKRLIVHRNTLQWMHVAPEPGDPEQGAGVLETRVSTEIDTRKGMSASWSPRRSKAGPIPAGEFSTVFAELWPAFPDRDRTLYVSRLPRLGPDGAPLPMLGDVRTIQTPDGSNDYTLILEFDPGSDPEADVDLTIRIIVEPEQ